MNERKPYTQIRCERCGKILRDKDDPSLEDLPCFHVEIEWCDYIYCESCYDKLHVFMENPNYQPHLPPANKFCGYPPPIIKDFDESVFDDEPEVCEEIEFKNEVKLEYIVIDCTTGKVKGTFEERALANDLAMQLNNKNGGYGFFVLCVDYSPESRE